MTTLQGAVFAVVHDPHGARVPGQLISFDRVISFAARRKQCGNGLRFTDGVTLWMLYGGHVYAVMDDGGIYRSDAFEYNIKRAVAQL